MPEVQKPHSERGVLVGTIITCLNGAPRAQRKNGLDALESLIEQFEAAIKLLREIDEANPNGYYGEFSVRAFLGVNDGRD